MRPIPPSLLPSTLVWQAPRGGRSGAGEFEDERHTVGHVRFVPSQGAAVREASVHDPVTGTVYVDAANSAGVVPPLGALASVDGGDALVVRSVREWRGLGGRLHHTEVTLG